jgi:hypothetical protein
MKIAVIGGGIFGVTIAVRLSNNHTIDLFEKNEDIMMAASDINQCRVHRGYHYPRSNSTVKEVLDANISFTKEFGEAIIKNTENYYCISKKDSLVSGEEFIKFCKENNLEYEISTPNIINKDSIEICIKVKENLFDHKKLKKLCWKNLKKNNVNVYLNTEVTNEIFEKYDFVIICTYGQTTNLLEEFPDFQKEYQFEVCEKVFVKLPQAFDSTSVLVMDGPFMGIDPIGDTGMFIIGDVVHTVLQRSTGKQPIIDQKYLSLLNKGIINNQSISKFKQFIESGVRFMPELKNAIYVGSSFCIKTTLPNVDSTDERHTLINKINEKIVTVFSGKIPTCVEAAKTIEEIVKNK